MAVILLGAAGVYLMRNVGEHEAIRNATQLAEVAGHSVVAPFVTPALLRGDPASIERVDWAVRRGLLDEHVVRVKLWDPHGKIVYSDDHRLIGSRFGLAADERQALKTGSAAADVSDLSEPENKYERPFGKLLEVYVPIRSRDGAPLLFEMYERYSSISGSGRNLWLAFAPAILGALAVLWLIQLPLAWRGARHLREGQAERERLLRQAVESSEFERRRIARDLHDGAVQDLAGVSYSLTAAADTIDKADRAEVGKTLRDAAAGTRRTIRELRSLLVDIYPPDLHRTGLEAAIRDLVAPLGPRGIDVDLDLPRDLRLAPTVETLFYRCAQEALRNVVRHADASHVDVRVQLDDGVATLLVADDGRGFAGNRKEGHLGLVLLSDLAREAGGRLEVESAPAKGTRIFVEAPR